jgi:hypothetical protein
MIRIGIDVDIRTCREEGYPVALLKSKKNIDQLDPEKNIHLTISDPEMWPDGINKACTWASGIGSIDLYRIDSYFSFNDLKEQFLDRGEGIKSFCDFDNCPIELENPSIYDFLHLANTLDSYCGLY